MFGVAPRTSMYFASCTTPTMTGESGCTASSVVQRLPIAPPAGKNRRAIDWLMIVLRLPGRRIVCREAAAFDERESDGLEIVGGDDLFVRHEAARSAAGV